MVIHYEMDFAMLVSEINTFVYLSLLVFNKYCR